MRGAFWSVFIAVLLIDQVSKEIAMSGGQAILNTGASFGVALPGVTIGTVAVVYVLVCWFFLTQQLVAAFPRSCALILAGAGSNLLDRVLVGGVRDFIPIPLTPIHNNLADWAIALGVIALAYRLSLSRSVR